MTITDVFYRFPTQERCIEHLENVRWGDIPCCPLCGSTHVARKSENDRIGRWNCHDCNKSFNVMSGTILCKTRVPLQKWFLAIALMMNAKKSLSSPQLARDLRLTQQTALYMQQRIRAAMMDQESHTMLQGVVEADETYIGGKPRKANRRENDRPAKPGRSTKNAPVIGVVERGGRLVARVATEGLTGKAVVPFLKQAVIPQGSVLISDEFPSYNTARDMMPHAVINHSEAYVDGYVHTNTVEGFWALLKRAWYGSHHHYAKRYLPLYVAGGAAWKYNRRRVTDPFGVFIARAMA